MSRKRPLSSGRFALVPVIGISLGEMLCYQSVCAVALIGVRMEYALLRSLRALGPGLLLCFYADVFRVFVLKLCPYFWALDTSKLFLVGYVIGGVYGAATSHFSRETYAFAGVDTATLSRLATFAPEVEGRTWHEVSPCFFRLVDNDKSLEQKSKGVYFNGFIVTTCFEAVWISYLAALVGLACLICVGDFRLLLTAAVSALAARLLWRASVKRHCELAASQVNVIKVRFAEDFRECLRKSQLASSGTAK